MVARLGPPELLILLVIVILVFGVGRLSEIGAALGTTARDLRRAVQGGREADAPADRQRLVAVAYTLQVSVLTGWPLRQAHMNGRSVCG